MPVATLMQMLNKAFWKEATSVEKSRIVEPLIARIMRLSLILSSIIRKIITEESPPGMTIKHARVGLPVNLDRAGKNLAEMTEQANVARHKSGSVGNSFYCYRLILYR